jgi:hypothetical protein
MPRSAAGRELVFRLIIVVYTDMGNARLSGPSICWMESRARYLLALRYFFNALT